MYEWYLELYLYRVSVQYMKNKEITIIVVINSVIMVISSTTIVMSGTYWVLNTSKNETVYDVILAHIKLN